MSPLTMSVSDDGKLMITATGNWVAEEAARVEAAFPGLFSKIDSVKLTETSLADINLKAIDAFDTFGARLVANLSDRLCDAGMQVTLSGFADDRRVLLEAVTSSATGAQRVPVDFKETENLKNGLWSILDFLRDEVALFFVTFGAVIHSFLRLLVHPAKFRLTSWVYQFDRVVWKALPIVLMVIFILGAIIAQQGFFHFRRFGADLYVVDMVGFLMMREIGVLLVAIIIAGRTCSSYTAELGSMKMREEIDALRTMGFDPIDVLILPRILVLVVALPILSFIGSVAGLIGAGVVATLYAGMTADLFIERLRDAITLDHFLVGLIKAPFIGLVIGIISATEGLQVRGSTTSLGRRTTQSVVKSIFMIILLDGMFAVFFSGIRM